MKYSLSFAGTLAIGMIISFQYIDVTNGFPFEILLVGLVSFAVPCVLVMRDIKKDEKKNAVKRFEEFYDECQKYGIDSLENPGSAEKKQRMELLAKKYKYDLADSAIYQQFDDLHREKTQQEIVKEAQEKEEKRQKEQEEYAKLTHYAQFHGNDKPVAMLKDLARAATGGHASYIPMRKESDGAIMAGIASGIGGTVPALMSLSNTARSNEAVRQQNEAAHAVNMMIYQAQAEARKTAQEYRKKADELAIKLISDMPKEEVFRYLRFTDIKTSVSSAGSITVEAEAAVDGTATVFDKPGFVDGFVVAEIYSEKQKVGEAIMVFPVFGSDSYKFRVNEAEDRYFARRRTSRDPHYRKETVKIRGICLNCGEQGKNYTVKFVPGDLWIMEQ